MSQLIISLYSWNNGAFIMIGIFALVIIGLVGTIFLMMGSNKNKKDLIQDFILYLESI